MKNTWQKNCYENWKRIKYKTDWNSIYWTTLWILISAFFLGMNNFPDLIGYLVLLNCWIWIDEEERLYG